MLCSVFKRPAALSSVPRAFWAGQPSFIRSARYQAHDTGFDPDDLQAARAWHQTFEEAALPKGTTTYSRSSGPGGQHVNKTETKATTSWSVTELTAVLPKLLHPKLRSSRFYSKNTDSISIQAQTQRSRTANLEENRQKLFEELVSIYGDAVPGESSPDKRKKYEAIEKSFHEARVGAKKRQGMKKQFRRGGGDD